MTDRIKNYDLMTKVSKQMHDEIMGKIHVYARMTDNSDDIRNEEFQSSLVYLGSHILTGVLVTFDGKDEDSIKSFLAEVVLPMMLNILEKNNVKESS